MQANFFKGDCHIGLSLCHKSGRSVFYGPQGCIFSYLNSHRIRTIPSVCIEGYSIPIWGLSWLTAPQVVQKFMLWFWHGPVTREYDSFAILLTGAELVTWLLEHHWLVHQLYKDLGIVFKLQKLDLRPETRAQYLWIHGKVLETLNSGI